MNKEVIIDRNFVKFGWVMKNITNILGEPEEVVNVDDMLFITLTKDEWLQAAAQNFRVAISFRNPSPVLDQMVTDDFTYELPTGLVF